MKPSELTFVAAPRISLAQFTRVLVRLNSPVVPYARALYGICVAYGIDPAVALAFFEHESKCGTVGIVKGYRLKNWGAVRTPANKVFGFLHAIAGRGNFARFPSWLDGLADWCERILSLYIAQRGLTTVAAATPVYAPSSDANKPVAYAQAVADNVTAWMKEDGRL